MDVSFTLPSYVRNLVRGKITIIPPLDKANCI